MGTPPKPIISSTFSTIGIDTASMKHHHHHHLFLILKSPELNKKKHCLQGTDGNGDHPTTTFEQLAEVACSLFCSAGSIVGARGLPGFPG